MIELSTEVGSQLDLSWDAGVWSMGRLRAESLQLHGGDRRWQRRQAPGL